MQWGTVPAYFGGIALLLTIWVIMRDRQDRVRAQANQVAAWVQRGDEASPNRVVISNASDLPCFNLSISWSVGFRDPKKLRFSKTWGEDVDGKARFAYPHAVGPGETLIVAETRDETKVHMVAFTDAAGRRWRRGREQDSPALWHVKPRRLWRFQQTLLRLTTGGLRIKVRFVRQR